MSSVSTKKIQTINCDYLEITFTGNFNYLPDQKNISSADFNFVIDVLDYGTKFHKNQGVLYYLGQKTGVVCFNSRLKDITSKETITLKLENDVLYSENIFSIVNEFQKSFDIEFTHITRLDICLDNADVMHFAQKFVERKYIHKNQKLNTNGEKSGTSVKNVNFDNTNRVSGFNFGSKASDRYVRCYYKSLELKASNKVYIFDVWKKAGIIPKDETFENVTKYNIERYEMVFKKNFLDKLYINGNPISHYEILKSLNDAKFLTNLLQSCSKDYFCFAKFSQKKRLQDQKKNITRELKYETVKFSNPVNCTIERRNIIKKTDIFRLKQTAKTMYLLYKATDKDLYNVISHEIIKNIKHEQWKEKVLDRWDYESRLNKSIKNFYMPVWRMSTQLDITLFDKEITV